MVWGYVLGKAAARGRKSDLNILLLLLAGGLPDFDLFARQPAGTLFGHHGISHSWLVIGLLAIPFFYRFGRRTVPYFVAVIQHPIFGDLITNNIPLFFPFTLRGQGFELFESNPLAAIGLEVLGFALFLVYFSVSGDWKRRLESNYWNKLWLMLWFPVLALTIAEAVWYFEPTVVTTIYATYALISSVGLIWACMFMAIRSSMRK